jgi:hypothetical protein
MCRFDISVGNREVIIVFSMNSPIKSLQRYIFVGDIIAISCIYPAPFKISTNQNCTIYVKCNIAALILIPSGSINTPGEKSYLL